MHSPENLEALEKSAHRLIGQTGEREQRTERRKDRQMDGHYQIYDPIALLKLRG